jgi:parvulin-like peptidyl-prolyl isomerase
VREKVAVHAAKKRELEVLDDEVQEEAIRYIKSLGMRRAKEAYDWLEALGITMDDFEEFLTEMVFRKKVTETVTDDEAVEEYFKLNSPSFDVVDLKGIIVEGEDMANEIYASLEDDPDSFAMFVENYSLDDSTKENGGNVTGVRRSELPDEVSAKTFNAKPGDVLGPFRLGRTDRYQVVMVQEIHTAVLDDAIREKISKLLYDDWLNARLREHRVSV